MTLAGCRNCYSPRMSTIENKLKTASFWLKLGVINQTVALVVISLGCAYSGLTCQGESMKEVMSLYAFTIFTPQLALEVILLLALFLVGSSMRELRENMTLLMLFVGTFALLMLFVFWR